VAARIGYLPEEPAFYAWMTPVEFLEHVGSLFGLPGVERKRRTLELLDYVGRLFGLSSSDNSKRTGELLDLTGLSQVSKRRIGGF
jgi:ABC-2 type transport system ATP-binding protein